MHLPVKVDLATTGVIDQLTPSFLHQLGEVKQKIADAYKKVNSKYTRVCFFLLPNRSLKKISRTENNALGCQHSDIPPI